MSNNKILNIVLFNPEIPQNTGNIGRLCVCNNHRLHLIKPLGFELTDKYLKRAGMDYWQYLDYRIYENWEDFCEKNPEANIHFLSTKTKKIFWDCEFKANDYLIFGSEGKGLPPHFYEDYRDKLITIPMDGEHCRSLNLANSVSIVMFEAMRQLR